MNPKALSPASRDDLVGLHAGHGGLCSDKWDGILKKYDAIFPAWRNRPLRLLEIGVQNGGSLEVWAKYFRTATCIVGCDIDPACADLRFSDPRIHVVVGDAGSAETAALLGEKSPEFDVIIDDGSHTSPDIIRTFTRLFPRLAEGGVYVVEDLHCSYWAEFQGGLFAPHSAMAFFKSLCDIVNREHWGLSQAPEVVLNEAFPNSGIPWDPAWFRHLHAVEFSNSLCVIHKRSPEETVLGPRAVGGRSTPVSSALLAAAREDCRPPDQSLSPWSHPSCSPARIASDLARGADRPEGTAVSVAAFHDHIVGRDVVPWRQRAETLEKENAVLRADLDSVLAEFFAIKGTLSWRATAPLRRVRRFFMRVLGRFFHPTR